jgi:hypothetical protein
MGGADLPRRRKGIEYNPEISVLLRDAEPLWREIVGEPDLRKRRERIRARDLATDQLMRIARDVEKHGSSSQLDVFRVRAFCESLKARNRRSHRRRLPKAKGGRPLGESARLSRGVEILAAIEVRGKKNVTSVLDETADRLGLSYDYVSEIHYDPDPNWKLAVRAERAFKHEATAKPSALWFWDVKSGYEDWPEQEIFVAEGKKAWWRPCVVQVSSIGTERKVARACPRTVITACTSE